MHQLTPRLEHTPLHSEGGERGREREVIMEKESLKCSTEHIVFCRGVRCKKKWSLADDAHLRQLKSSNFTQIQALQCYIYNLLDISQGSVSKEFSRGQFSNSEKKDENTI